MCANKIKPSIVIQQYQTTTCLQSKLTADAPEILDRFMMFLIEHFPLKQ